MNGWLMVALGVGVLLGIVSMALDRAWIDARPPVRCVCSCDGDAAVLDVTTEADNTRGLETAPRRLGAHER